MDRIETLKRAIRHYGIEHQKKKIVEELLELGKEVIKDNDIDKIAEELADVEIMLHQLYMIYGFDIVAIDKIWNEKLERLEQRMLSNEQKEETE